MKNLSVFLFSSVCIFLFSSFLAPESAAVLNIADNYPDPASFNIEEFVAYLVALVGGLLTTIIVKFLKAKFPTWFPESEKKLKQIIREEMENQRFKIGN